MWISAHAVAAIEAEARCYRVRETGGALFGYPSEDGDLVVTRAFGPGPNAIRRRFRLISDHDHTQLLIDRVFEETNGRDGYLGDWHTHPRGRARPSRKDADTLLQIATEEAVGLTNPLALIQATKPLRRRIGMGALNAFIWDPDLQVVLQVPTRMPATESKGQLKRESDPPPATRQLS